MNSVISSFIPFDLNFAWYPLFIVLPLPILIYFLSPKSSEKVSALSISTFSVIKTINPLPHSRGSFLKLSFLGILWILFLLAAARPQLTQEIIELPSSGRDLLLAVDISGSMKIEDMVVNGRQTSRIRIVKDVVNDFVQKRTGDRLGLIVFGTKAYLHVPLTFDRTVVGQQLQEAQLGFAGINTAIGDAIALSIKKLREQPSSSLKPPSEKGILPLKADSGRLLILLTDGANTAGEITPKVAAKLAKTANIKIYTIGIGADTMVERGLFFNREVNPSADLDEKILTEIAETTGGKYFRARNPEELKQIYQAINLLEPITQEKEVLRPIRELFFYPLALAITLSFIWMAAHPLYFLKASRGS